MCVLKILSAAICLSCFPGLAGAWTAENHHRVAPVSKSVFEVVGRSGSAGPQYWCAAGDFARRVLGTSAVQRIYLVRGPGVAQTQNRNKAVLFSLTSPDNSDTTHRLTLSVKQVGSNLSTAMARQYCQMDISFGP